MGRVVTYEPLGEPGGATIGGDIYSACPTTIDSNLSLHLSTCARKYYCFATTACPSVCSAIG